MSSTRNTSLVGTFFAAMAIALSSTVAGANEIGPASADIAKGEAVYNGTCVACHGETGTGEFDGIPDLTDSTGSLLQDDETLLHHITEGYQSEGSFMGMPAKGGDPDLTDEDIQNVLAYIRATFGTQITLKEARSNAN